MTLLAALTLWTLGACSLAFLAGLNWHKRRPSPSSAASALARHGAASRALTLSERRAKVIRELQAAVDAKKEAV